VAILPPSLGNDGAAADEEERHTGGQDQGRSD
jgi:hypothetical protein